jgi:CMP-N-acetylneuraminic acid synthetase
MKILGVIPARAGSKGVLNKNVRPLSGVPLIAYTIEASMKSRLSKVIVSTDSEEIASIARSHNAEVPFLRPKELATDRAKAIPVIQHALKFLRDERNENYDAVMMLQPTTPFRQVTDIDLAISMMEEEEDIDSVISVIDVEGHHPARMKFLDQDGFLVDPQFCEEYENQPRQELAPMYLRNGAIYLTRTSILEQGSFKGKRCKALIMPMKKSINIDSTFDFDMAEWIQKHYLS